MNRRRVIAFALLASAALPLSCSAQSTSVQTPLESVSAYTVSARELSIPGKAHKAFVRGDQLLAISDWAGGLAEFQKAIAAFPNYYEAYDKIGDAELDLDRSADAESAFRKAIRLSDGRYAPSHSGLGLALCMEGRFSEAETSARAGVELDPAYAAGHFALAWVMYAMGRRAEALQESRKAVEEKPDLAAAYLLLAQIEMQQHALAALVADLGKYLELEPSGPATARATAIRDEALRTLADEGSTAVAQAQG